MGIWAWIKSKFSGISDEAICEFASVVTGEAYDDTRRVYDQVVRQVAKAESFSDLPGSEKRAYVITRLRDLASEYLPQLSAWALGLLLEIAVARMRRGAR